MGVDCYIQQYPDRDPGPGVADFTCGPLSYDGHDGTDIAVPTLADMAAGVDVIAAAPGVVRRLRDGMEDRISGPDEDLGGRDCGNGVVVDHGGGWETQYCHLRPGSIPVIEGQRVPTGTVLGQIGLSGRTQFPHLEFIVRQDGKVLDPFDTANFQSCGGETEPLWRDPPAYQPGGLLDVGVADVVPDYAAIKAGLPTPEQQAPDAPLVLWGLMFGTRQGDMMEFALDGPGGAVHRQEVALDRTQAMAFRASGRRAPQGGWPPGTYEGEVSMVRDGAVISSRAVTIRVAP